MGAISAVPPHGLPRLRQDWLKSLPGRLAAALAPVLQEAVSIVPKFKNCRCSPSSSLSKYLSKMGSSLTTCCVADDRIEARWALKSLDWKYRFQNCSSESFNQSIQYCWCGLINMRSLHFLRYVITVSRSHDRVLVKDVMYKLRGNSDLDLASFDGLRSRIHKLTWFPFTLAFRCCLS